MSDMKGKFKKSVSKDETFSSSSTSSFSSDESDGDADLKPIKDYLTNRREVAKQLFKSVKIEKVRMMLPQVLKKMELSELEEWCASELCGMSKTRILSILNGAPMSGSSDTSDSDSSGPSLEIISDTEEWLTDDDLGIKREPLSPTSKPKKLKPKRKTKAANKADTDKTKARKGKLRPLETDLSKVKKEKEKAEPPKEGESLLDLLELEMRARAIRALIRKEEDIIPDSALGNALKSTLTSVTNAKTKAGQDSRTAESSAILIEKIGEDEDVVLLVKPTPTIELISSDSEPENLSERVNKKLRNERTPEKTRKSQKGQKNQNVSKPVVMADNPNHSNTTVMKCEPTKSVETHKASTENAESSESLAYVGARSEITDGSNDPNESSEMGKQTFRKLKRRRQIRERSSSVSECPEATDILKANAKEKRCDTPEEGEVESSEEKTEGVEEESGIQVKREMEKADSTKKAVTLNDDKLGEYDEIIDLDDYPDDMYNIEPEENPTIEEEVEKVETKETTGGDDNQGSTETWATRYYQTDNVQSVIKESKIQSEIRKRLRERQRLSKLNNSPKETPKVNEDNDAKDKFKPTGSVDEYFALKGTGTAGDSNLSPSSTSETKNNDEGQVNEKTLPGELPTMASPPVEKLLDEANESAVTDVKGDGQKGETKETIEIFRHYRKP